MDTVSPRKQLAVDEDALQSDLPVISADDAANIRRYLKQHHLQVSDIHLLEGLLLAQLEEIDSENTRTLYSDEIAAQSLSNDITKVQGAAECMGEWLRHHDRQLNRMKVGISQIEHRNHLLDLQERNHTLLADTLQSILDDLKLDDDISDELKSPSVLSSSLNFSAFSGTVAAAKELNSVLQKRFLNGLENLAAVREKRQEAESLRKSFCEQVVIFFSNLFLAESKKLYDPALSATESALPDNEKLHLSLGKYDELVQVLESLDRNAFVSLRPNYTRQIAACYSSHFSSFFQTQKKNIVKEKRDNSLSAMPVSVEPTVAINRTGSRSVIRDTKRTITAVLESALEQALPVLVSEQDFCLDYFGFKLKSENDANPTNDEEMDRMNQSNITEMMKLLFKGIEEEFVGLVDKGDEMDHLYSLKMLVKVEQLQQQYVGSCHYADAMLSHLRNQTKVLFEEFTKEQLAWVENLKISTKRSGILPPFARLPAFIEKMEHAANCYSNRCATVDDTYIKIIECMINWLPQVASQEPKYKTLVMMENSHFFWRTMVNLSIPCLSNYSRKAFDMYKEHRDLYVSWSVKYEFSKLFDFFELLESTASSLSSIKDVPFTPGLSKQDLRAMVKNYLTKKKIQKGVSSMLQRLIKHLGEKHQLMPYVWACMSESFVSSFKKFETLVSQCYQAEEIGLTADDINSAFSSGSGEALIEKLSESAASRSIIM